MISRARRAIIPCQVCGSSFRNIHGVLAKELRNSLEFDGMMGLPFFQLLFNCADQHFHGSRFDEVIIHLTANGLEGGFEGGIAGENQGYALGLGAAHGTDNGKAIPRVADVQVGDQYVERPFVH